jgi:hypothetical protein
MEKGLLKEIVHLEKDHIKINQTEMNLKSYF